MLDESALKGRYAVFDHNWRYYSEFLGEPYHVGDFLLYFDGTVLYICAFRLGQPEVPCTLAELSLLLHSRAAFASARLVNVWGNFSPPQSIAIGGIEHPIISDTGVNNDAYSVAIPITCFSYDKLPRARMSYRLAKNRGITTQVRRLTSLSAEHLSLITEWQSIHIISQPHRAMALATNAYLKMDDVYVVEASSGHGLVGFSVLGTYSCGTGFLVSSFTRNVPGGRVGDALKIQEIEFCRSARVHTLHLGYSATTSLLAFKQKWHAITASPPFREAFFTCHDAMRQMVSDERFLWCHRLLGGQ